VIVSLLLPEDLRAQIAREAEIALPRECCGLIEGYREDARAVATALHPTRNIAREDDRFEIDPAQHVALLKKLRGSDREIIGCYHSHPNGRAAPSDHDRAAAGEAGFFWLIQAAELRGFVWDGAVFCGVALALSALLDPPAQSPL
jgi:proteasome lid subunit RPN8/RPN11